MTPLIAITGGIGSGKSAVCHCLESLGFRVYDCDSRAKLLMDRSSEIHQRLAKEIAPEVVSGDVIDRKRLASIVFADAEKLCRLNVIVHHHVADDIHRWRERHQSEPLLFVETAILLESGLQNAVDEVWKVDASQEVRLERASRRDSAPKEAILARMQRQRDVAAADLAIPLRIINNDGPAPILPQIFSLLALHNISPETLSGQWKN